MVSQQSSSETVIKGVKGYHESVLDDVEINERKIDPPPRIELNKINISMKQNATIKAFKI